MCVIKGVLRDRNMEKGDFYAYGCSIKVVKMEV